MPFFYMDYWYIVLVVPVLILSVIIQMVMKSTYRKYSQIFVHSGLTGAEMAERVLRENGVYDVRITHIEGELSDHYDPKSRTIRLSDSVYSGRSVSALGVACHEAGHAVQHARSYMPLIIRNSIVPAVNFCSGISWIVLIVGFFLQYGILINIGIILFASSALFQLITLPVEFNASARAISALKGSRALGDDEIKGAKKVLGAAAMTYVAALAASIVSVLRLIMITRGNRRD